MGKLLYVVGSAIDEISCSKAVADAFITAYRNSHSKDEVTTLNVFKMDLPPFDGLRLTSKYKIMHGQPSSAEEAQAWKAVETVINQFKSADKYVFTVPMWNFGIPYRLKQYLDVIIQPTYTFSFSPANGYTGLVTGKPALVVYARGGKYGEGPESAGYDFQKRYMELALGFIGFKDIRSILVEPTLAEGPKVAEAQRGAAIKKAMAMATTF